MPADRIPILLDTDIGSDIDDAVCLAYLLRQPRCELVGITSVSGRDPRLRASLVDAVCRSAGRSDIPIHSGSPCRMLTGEVVQPDVPQAAVLERFAHRPPADFAPATAVGFLHQAIRARPGEITLLAIGPMTNLGLLFAMDPEIPRLLRSLVLMCGFFGAVPWHGNCHREWNAICDPEATDAVYRALVPQHLSLGLDVTTRVTMPAPDCIARFRAIGGPLGVVSAMTEVFGKQAETVTFHDPLAAAAIFKPEICTWRAGRVGVETSSARTAGITLFDPAEAGPHRVAWEVDAPAFFAEFFGIVGS